MKLTKQDQIIAVAIGCYWCLEEMHSPTSVDFIFSKLEILEDAHERHAQSRRGLEGLRVTVAAAAILT